MKSEEQVQHEIEASDVVTNAYLNRAVSAALPPVKRHASVLGLGGCVQPDPPIGRYFERMLDRAASIRRQVIGSPSGLGNDYAPDNGDLLERTKHVRLRVGVTAPSHAVKPCLVEETMMQFFARTGCPLSFVMTHSADEIAQFCKTAEEVTNAEQRRTPQA